MEKSKINKKVCLITSGHLSSDPRLCKEAMTLGEKGFNVHIIFIQNLAYLIHADQAILSKNPTWTIDILQHSKKNISTFIQRKIPAIISKVLSVVSINSYTMKLFAVLIKNQNYGWQISKALKAKADLYIGHDLGTLPVIVKAAKKNNAVSIFDAEDFHRYEITNNEESKEYKLTKHIEDKYIPQTDSLTAASPLIANEYAQLYDRTVTSILNVFPKPSIEKKKTLQTGLKLFWFSQCIGAGRGLENIFLAIDKLKTNNISITILGDLSEFNKKYFNDFFLKHNISTKNIHFKNPVLSDELMDYTSKFDIGLATEIDIPKNRNICLTNKIFTYIQAGLAVFASDTLAQRRLMDSLQDVGKIYKKDDINDICEKLSSYLLNKDLLRAHQENAFKAGIQTLNWETESKKLVIVVAQALGIKIDI